MSTKYNCAKCGCIISNIAINVVNDETFCPECKNWSKYIATTTPDDVQEVDVVLVKYYCSECDHELSIEVVGTENYKNEVKCIHCKNMVYVCERITDTPATPTTEKHSDHYQIMPIEPFVVMEQRMKMHPGGESIHGMMEGKYPCALEKLALAIALKHIMRAGFKDGQPWRKDIEKAMNYLHRALTGKWLGDSDE